MSTVYNLEPPPTAKCILHTTSGDLELELFAQQAPLACRSFLQHCLDDYYTSTIFHRLIPGFILQGGDPTGTGSGGTSALENGAPFEDEFHSRLKFNRRGLLGMANGGSRNDNGSQFFLTLGKAEELNGKHTLFGRIVGDTIYNLVKMSEAEVGEGERPLYPCKITGATVVVNPFEGMIRRVKAVEAPVDKVVKKKKPVKKGKQLLSFDVEDGEDAPVVRKNKANPRFKDAEPTASPAKKSDDPARIATNDKTEERKPAKEAYKAPLPIQRKATPPPPQDDDDTSSSSEANSDRDEDSSKSPTALSKADQQIEQLKQSLRRNAVESQPEVKQKKKSALEAYIPETATRGRKRKAPGSTTSSAVTADELKVVEQFRAFQDRIKAATKKGAREGKENTGDLGDGAAESTTSHDIHSEERKKPKLEKDGEAQAPAEEEEEEDLCDLHFLPHCQSCAKWNDEISDEDNDDESGLDWMAHKLTFAKDRLGKDLEWKKQNEMIVESSVFDPKTRSREFRGERGGGGAGERGFRK